MGKHNKDKDEKKLEDQPTKKKEEKANKKSDKEIEDFKKEMNKKHNKGK